MADGRSAPVPGIGTPAPPTPTACIAVPACVEVFRRRAGLSLPGGSDSAAIGSRAPVGTSGRKALGRGSSPRQRLPEAPIGMEFRIGRVPHESSPPSGDMDFTNRLMHAALGGGWATGPAGSARRPAWLRHVPPARLRRRRAGVRRGRHLPTCRCRARPAGDPRPTCCSVRSWSARPAAAFASCC